MQLSQLEKVLGTPAMSWVMPCRGQTDGEGAMMSKCAARFASSGWFWPVGAEAESAKSPSVL